MRLTGFLLCLFLLPGLSASAQDAVISDTVRIEEVVISSKKPGQLPAPQGFRKALINKSLLSDHSLGSVADAISFDPSFSVKSYGLGGIATPSFRGTGAGNTGFTWNGISISNPMLGQTDMSLLPAGMADDIHIYYGGASMAVSSGSSGGLVDLVTVPEWRKETAFSVSSSTGSFGTLSGLASMRTGSENFSSGTKAFISAAENDFPYIDRYSGNTTEWKRRINNHSRHSGFMQELYYRSRENIFSARIWYQRSERGLPSSILASGTGPESQKDESLRTMLNYEANGRKGSFFVTAAAFFSVLDYTNLQPLVESRNKSASYIIKTGYRKRIAGKAVLNVTLDENLTGVRTNNYAENVSRNTAGLSVSLDEISAGRLSGSLMIREILDIDRLLLPDFSTGLQLRLDGSGNYLVKANVSRSSRIPTLNDMYFNPGGNPYLRNEYAYISELDFSMQQDLLPLFHMNYDLSFFRNSIKDMIRWHEGESAYWTADNISKVNTMGLETSISFDFESGKFRSSMAAGYAYTRAYDDSGQEEKGSSGYQLIYVPLSKADACIRVAYGIFYSSWRSGFIGKRFTANDNSAWLPWYSKNDLTAGLRHDTGWGSFDLALVTENILNAEYQAISYYPMPGRCYQAKAVFQFIKRKK